MQKPRLRRLECGLLAGALTLFLYAPARSEEQPVYRSRTVELVCELAAWLHK